MRRLSPGLCGEIIAADGDRETATTDPHHTQRIAMVDRQIARRGIADARVLAAMRAVPRDAFVPAELADAAHDDRPLPIGAGQTISQPYIVALMSAALNLRGGETVLEVGTGSGYAAAVLARLAAQVHSVERLPDLAAAARTRLQAQAIANVDVHEGDGTLGWPAAAPYDAIVVMAGGPHLPPALLDQLAEGGRLVIPVGPEPGIQQLLRVTRLAHGDHSQEVLCSVCFVPLVGAQGWNDG